VVALKLACLAAARTNNIQDPLYKRIFSRELQKAEYVLEAKERQHLIECMDNLAEIEVWRATLREDERRAWNHPSTVLKKWRASVRGEPASSPKVKEGLREMVNKLQAENDRLKRQLDKDAPFTADDSAKDIADTLFRLHFSESKMEAISKEFRRLAKKAFERGRDAS
jgi:hypothetical protein